MKQNPLIIFYALLIYVTTQLFWWSVLLIRFEPTKKTMIIGEVAVFLLLLAVGAYKIHQAHKEEERLNARQRNFLLSVTHELKSPLASIKLYIETILKRNLDKERQEAFLKNSLRDIERLHDLLENMLLASRYDKIHSLNSKEKFNFSQAVEKVVSRLQANVCDNRVLLAEIEPNINMFGDAFALTSVASNLIENAIKYSPKCEQVLVQLVESQHQVILKVIDRGVGIPDEEKQRIFDKFYRVGDENTRSTKGTGLGLFIVKQVLDNHQAHIEVKNNIPSGTIFQVTFNTYRKYA